MHSLSRLRPLLGAVPIALVLGVFSLSPAQGAPTPTIREHVAPGASLDLVTPYDSPTLHATVVRPGIAVATASDAGVDPQFLANIKVLLDTIATTAAGKTLLESLGDLAPLHETDDDAARARDIYFVDTATVEATDINVVIQQGRWAADTTSRGADGYGAVAQIWSEPELMTTYRNPGMSGEFVTTPDTSMFHELVHASHFLSGSRSGRSQRVSPEVIHPVTGEVLRIPVPVEEARTHGSLNELFAANGGERLPDGGMKINANPLDVRSIELATGDLTRALAVLRTKQGNTPFNVAVAKDASRTLAARELVAGLTERTYVKQRGLIFRDSYTRMSPDPDPGLWRLDSPADLPRFMQQLNTRGQAVQLHPESSGVPMSRAVSVGRCVSADPASSCGVAEEAPPPTDDERRAQEEFDRSVVEHGEPVVEGAAEAVVGELSPSELAAYAGVRVGVAGEEGFTGDLGESYRTGKVFVPTGASSASKLAEGWRFANEASLGVGVILWIKGVVETFQSDSTDLDKSTAALALVPGVGQILGIHDGLQHKDPAFVVSNVTALLSFALDLVGQPELALVLGVVSFVTAIVDMFLNMDPNDARYQSYASWSIEGRRDAAWKSEVAKGLLRRRSRPW